jgi:hypothetical protein
MIRRMLAIAAYAATCTSLHVSAPTHGCYFPYMYGDSLYTRLVHTLIKGASPAARMRRRRYDSYRHRASVRLSLRNRDA